MRYQELKRKLLGQFDHNKLVKKTDEWGFYQEPRDVQQEIGKLGYAVNITPEVVETAAQAGVQLLLTHHDAWPFVFGLRERCDALLAEAGMAQAFFHAPLDDADFGTSASLAAALGVQQARAALPYEQHFLAGRIGELAQPLPLGEFAEKLAGLLEERPRLWQNNGWPVQKVCVTTGAGYLTTDLQQAVEAGCDTYVTGEYGLYTQQYARLAGLNLLVGSHTATELLGVQSLAERLAADTDLLILRVPEALD